MKSQKFILLLVALVFSVLLMTGCSAIPIKGNLVMGRVYTLQSGRTLNDDLTVMGGVATIERDAKVQGDLAVLGGSVNVDGEITGDIAIMGGSVNLGDHAVVGGNITQLGGNVSQQNGAVVNGESNPRTAAPMRVPNMNINFDPIFEPIFAFFRAVGMAALAVLASLFALRPMQRVSQAVVAQPIITGGIGLLTIVVAPALVVVLAITIILIPVSLVGVLILGIAVAFGWLALGLLVGRQISVWVKQSWTDPISAGVGTLALTLTASLLNVIPCIGWLATLVIATMGLGAVLLTRFGLQTYPVPVYTGSYTAPAAAPTQQAQAYYPSQQPLQPSTPAAPTPQDLFAGLDEEPPAEDDESPSDDAQL